MPTADSGIVRRDTMPAAMPSCMAPIQFESALSSGVRMKPPTAQIEIKKKIVPARNISSVLSPMNPVTRFMARSSGAPSAVHSTRHPHISARIESPMRNSKSGQRTFSRPRGCPAML